MLSFGYLFYFALVLFPVYLCNLCVRSILLEILKQLVCIDNAETEAKMLNLFSSISVGFVDSCNIEVDTGIIRRVSCLLIYEHSYWNTGSFIHRND